MSGKPAARQGEVTGRWWLSGGRGKKNKRQYQVYPIDGSGFEMKRLRRRLCADRPVVLVPRIRQSTSDATLARLISFAFFISSFECYLGSTLIAPPHRGIHHASFF
ncbi:hypothetical protein [Escherichia coli]|uniref:hypothetical protein n=1 Tax=Escherichia coli TaxID=562 RepID=UPI0039A03971